MNADRGLELALSIADEKLEAMERYFDNLSDADSEGQNDEMRMLSDVKWLRWTLRRVAASKPVPTASDYLAGRIPS